MGLVIPNLAHSFFAQLAVELSAALRMNSFTLFISSSEEDPELEQREIDNLLARGVDALLIASTQPSPETFCRLEEGGSLMSCWTAGFRSWRQTSWA
jgi:LacI family transcriptional regulator